MKLFRCSGVVSDFMGFKNVELVFLQTANRRELGQILPYEQLVEGYNLMDDNARLYAEGAVDELFQLHEVEQLHALICENFDMEFCSVEADLPLPGDLMATFWMPVGGAVQFHHLPKEIPWTFDFSVEVYFDRREYTNEAAIGIDCHNDMASTSELSETPTCKDGDSCSSV